MKNKGKRKSGNDFSALQNKIFFRTALMLFIAVVIIYALYTIFLRGYFADAVVGFLYKYFYDDYYTALDAYWRVFRNAKDVFIMAAVFAVFLVILRIYLRNFTKYFNEINGGIDALVQEGSDEVVLSPELSAAERKINDIKNTLEKRKVAAEIAEKRKNDLVVYLAHDLKTPLTSIIGYLTLLRDERQIPEELQEKYLSISLEKAERLEDLINEFFDITRFNLSNVTLEYSRVNLTRLLEQLTYEFKPMLLEKNLKCELEIAPDAIITCDVNKMQRVLDNLLRNAVNYSFEDRTIHIAATQSGNNMSIRFTNCGRTIPKEKLNAVFEQFYRLDTSRSSKSGGAGLGLAIAKQIVELHNGTITARSENEVIEFEVVLPVS